MQIVTTRKSNNTFTKIETEVSKLTIPEVNELSEKNNYIIRGRYKSKMLRSKFIGKPLDLDVAHVEAIEEKLKKAKRKFFIATRTWGIGMTDEERADKLANANSQYKGRAIKTTGNILRKQRYICTMENGVPVVVALAEINTTQHSA